MRVLSFSLDAQALTKASALSERLCKYGGFVERLDVLVPSKKNAQVLLSHNVCVYGVGGVLRPLQLLMIFMTACGLQRKQHYGVVTSQDAYFLGCIAYICARVFGSGFEVQAHGIEKDFFFRRKIAGFVYRHADSIRVVSEGLKRELIKRYRLPSAHFVVIPIFVATDELQLHKDNPYINMYTKVSPEALQLLCVGRLVEVKNTASLLNMVAKLLPDYPHMVLNIVGDGPLLPQLQSLARSLRIERNIVFHGNLSRKALGGLYMCCDVFVHASHSEGYGMVFIEALEAGIPMVVTRVGCIETYEDVYAALQVVDVNDEDAFRAGVEAFLRSLPKKRQPYVRTVTKEEIYTQYKSAWEKINTR